MLTCTPTDVSWAGISYKIAPFKILPHSSVCSVCIATLHVLLSVYISNSIKTWALLSLNDNTTARSWCASTASLSGVSKRNKRVWVKHIYMAGVETGSSLRSLEPKPLCVSMIQCDPGYSQPPPCFVVCSLRCIQCGFHRWWLPCGAVVLVPVET